MFRLISFLKFYFSATNQHGVHSPFVYDYVTKCLYKKNKIRLPVTQKLLVKSILYFNYKTIQLLVKETNFEKNIRLNCPAISQTTKSPDVVFGTLEGFKADNFDITQQKNNAMLVIDGIHQSKENLENWENLKNHDHVSVSIDLFYCGVIFFRSEQVKEHFKIRI